MTIDEKREIIKKVCEIRENCAECPLKYEQDGIHCCYSSKIEEEKINKYYSIITGTTAKADAGKPKLTLVPQQILYDIAEVREYGCKKYHNPDNWKQVEKQRYRDAAFRHFLAYLREPNGVDEESGIEHLKHLAANIAFLCELEKKGE